MKKVICRIALDGRDSCLRICNARPAQETITVVPKGTAPTTAQPPNTSSHGPGSGHDYGPFPGLGAILAAPFDTTTSNPADTTPPKARCRVNLDFNDSEARPTAVCSP